MDSRPLPQRGESAELLTSFLTSYHCLKRENQNIFSPFDARVCISTEIDLLLYNIYNMPNANQVEYNKIKPVKGTLQSHFNQLLYRGIGMRREIRPFVDMLSSEQRPSLFWQLFVILCQQTDFHTIGFGRLNIIEDYRN